MSAGKTIKIGDAVKHHPSGEEWIVGRVDPLHVYPLGWPCCRADITDCELLESCSEKEHHAWVEKLKELPAEDPRHIS